MSARTHTSALSAQLVFDYGELKAADIKACESAVERISKFQRRIAGDIIAIGKELIAVKERLEHGQFGPWLKHHFGWSQPTASRMMQAAETFGGWKNCLGELIDNAFDAKANSVKIELGGRKLVIEDDGIGCDEVDSFFREGRHRSRNGLGRFGVGLKDAALWLWGATEVTSIAKSGGVHCTVNWQKVIDSGQFKSYARHLPGSDNTGTRIAFSRILRNAPNDVWCMSELGYRYFPAIESGRHIVVRRGKGRAKPVPAFQFPPLEGVIEHESEIDGKKFSVRAGIVQEGHPNPYPGFTIAYKHRVITTTSEGCGDFGTARFAGVVRLDESWKLSRNKDSLLEDGGLLVETLHMICRDTLVAASEQNRLVTLAGIESTIAANLMDALKQRKKEARNPGTSHGTVKPSGTGRRRRNATNTQPGDTLTSKIGGGVSVQFVHGLNEIGQTSFNESGSLISLNADDSYVMWAREHEDTNTLTALAATILAIDASTIADSKTKQKLLPGIEEDDIRLQFLGGLQLYTQNMKSKAEKQ